MGHKAPQEEKAMMSCRSLPGCRAQAAQGTRQYSHNKMGWIPRVWPCSTNAITAWSLRSTCGRVPQFQPTAVSSIAHSDE